MSQAHAKLVEAGQSPQHAAKQKLVDAIRMLERADIIDHNGHCSIRRDAGSFWINSGASVRGALTAVDIVALDLEGQLVEGEARPPLEFHIHSEIYRRRADVNAVAHTHPKWSTFLSEIRSKPPRPSARQVFGGSNRGRGNPARNPAPRRAGRGRCARAPKRGDP